MRRHSLPPPRAVRAQVSGGAEHGEQGVSGRFAAEGPREGPAPAADPATAGSLSAIPHRDVLPAPSRAFPRLRKMFDPRFGWFRRLERDVSHLLSLHVYPWIPGIHYLYGVQLERYLTVSEAEIGIDHLPQGFEGLRILLITDIHTGPFLSRRSLQRALNRLLTLEPDLILLGGDFTTCQISEIIPSLPAFRTFGAPLGTYAVLGNHDHYTGDPARLAALLESIGVRVLHNSGVVLERGGGRLALAGIDDLYQGHPDLGAALAAVRSAAGWTDPQNVPASFGEARTDVSRAATTADADLARTTVDAAVARTTEDVRLYETVGVGGSMSARTRARGDDPGRVSGWAGADSRTSRPAAEPHDLDASPPAPFLQELRSHVVQAPQGERTPVLLLSHNPDILFEASAQGVDLVLAGHTHGGQIRIPGLPVIVRQSRYRLDEGRYIAKRTELVVSRGIGVSGVPLRLACSPEAVLIHLRRR